MKNWGAALLSHFLGDTTKLAYGWRVERKDNLTFGWTTFHKPFTIAGVVYQATTGLDVSSTQTTDTMAVPTIDVTAFLDITTEAAMLAGIWDGAVVTMFELDRTNVPTTFDVTKLNVLRYGTLGRISLQGLVFRAELRGLVHRLETQGGSIYTPLCPWQLGDAVCSAGGLNIVAYTYSGTVSAVGANPRLRFSAAALTQRANVFNLGTIAFTSGANVGLPKMDIRTWRERQFTMQRPLPYAVAVGDTFSAVWGDDKTAKTCRVVFNNIGQHRGFGKMPGIDQILTNPATWSQRPLEERPPDENPDNNPNDPGSGEQAGTTGGNDPGEGGKERGGTDDDD